MIQIFVWIVRDKEANFLTKSVGLEIFLSNIETQILITSYQVEDPVSVYPIDILTVNFLHYLKNV